MEKSNPQDNWRGRIETKLDILTDLVKNHLKHHFIFEMTLLGIITAIGFLIASILWR